MVNIKQEKCFTKMIFAKNIQYKILLAIGVSLFLGAHIECSAQSDVINNVKTAMKAGSSKELTKYFNDMVEMVIDGDPSDYSRTQAEFVLKDFFRKYPPTDFQYIHQGASKEGIRYAIGKYTYETGSFRVLLRAKEIKDGYKVYSIDFTKD